jgi:uncharacterized membrane protein YccF (DUF307 family)
VRVRLNVIWLVCGGFLLVLGYALAGVVGCILIVTIPYGVAAFRVAHYALWPFGRATVPRPTAGALTLTGRVIWFIVAGWWLALVHFVLGTLQFAFVINNWTLRENPNVKALAFTTLRLVPVAAFPLGYEIVADDDIRVDRPRLYDR